MGSFRELYDDHTDNVGTVGGTLLKVGLGALLVGEVAGIAALSAAAAPFAVAGIAGYTAYRIYKKSRAHSQAQEMLDEGDQGFNSIK